MATGGKITSPGKTTSGTIGGSGGTSYPGKVAGMRRTVKTRPWYSRRKAKDAPSSVDDMAATKQSAWADGYNAAIEEFHAELTANLQREGFVDG